MVVRCRQFGLVHKLYVCVVAVFMWKGRLKPKMYKYSRQAVMLWCMVKEMLLCLVFQRVLYSLIKPCSAGLCNHC